MIDRIAPVARAMLAVFPAALIATFWWVLVDDISLARAFSSPIPYAMMVLGLFAGVPTYFLAHLWLGNSLARFILLASIAIAPACIFAAIHFLYPRSVFAAGLLMSTAWVGIVVFYFQVRKLEF